jgi:vancomycin resistance protein YoaR
MSATVPVKPAAIARPFARPVPPAALAAAGLLWRALAVAVLFVAAGALGLALYAQAHAGRVHEGVALGGVPVGGLTEPEARAAVEKAWRGWAETPLTLDAGTRAFALVPAAAGIGIDVDASVDAAMAFGREGSAWERSQAWMRGLVRGTTLPLVVTVDAARSPVALAAAVPGVERPAEDARVDMDAAGAPALVPDRPGVAIDAGATLAAVAARGRALSAEPVALVTRAVPAAVAAADLAPALAEARGAVDAPLVIRGAGATWHVPAADLARLVAVDPVSGDLVADRRALAGLVEGLAGAIDRPVADADVVVDDGRLVAVPAVTGRAVNVPASLDRLADALLAGKDRADLVVRETPPAIADAAAERAAARGEALLDGGMTLTWQGGRAALTRGDLLRALTIRIDPAAAEPFRFGLDRAVLAETLAPLAEEFDRPVTDASFRLVNGIVTLVADGQSGRALDLDRGVDAVVAAWGAKPGPTAKLPVATIRPEWTAKDAGAIVLGSDVLAEGGTWYGDSSDARRRNVELAAANVGGWLVPPGGEFSYVERIGDVSEAAGYVTGYGIIEQGGAFTTAPVVGGGICQVSTTIYQAAFWAGLPILERYQHPYYMRLYGEGPTGLPGLDAMVNIEPTGSLDLRFANTTGHWIAVEVFADGENVWTRIVGTDPGWDIEVGEPEITNRAPADQRMYFTDSPELPAGTEKVVESATDGFDVSLTRTVRKGGEVLDVYTVSSSFTPSRNLTMRGTGPVA